MLTLHLCPFMIKQFSYFYTFVCEVPSSVMLGSVPTIKSLKRELTRSVGSWIKENKHRHEMLKTKPGLGWKTNPEPLAMRLPLERYGKSTKMIAGYY